MVGSKRCYLCGERFVRGEDVIVCPECGARYHADCAAAREETHCPRCADEAWIAIVEF
jgi:predicted  nucleic acid-binding Zn-ribbon protein